MIFHKVNHKSKRIQASLSQMEVFIEAPWLHPDKLRCCHPESQGGPSLGTLSLSGNERMALPIQPHSAPLEPGSPLQPLTRLPWKTAMVTKSIFLSCAEKALQGHHQEGQSTERWACRQASVICRGSPGISPGEPNTHSV